MNIINCNCFLCGENAYYEVIPTESRTYYSCDICGKYKISDRDRFQIDRNYFASYLYYTNTIFSQNNDNNNFCYIGSKEGYADMHKIYPQSRLVTKEDVLNWYPSNFNEKIDKILLGLAKLSNYIGNIINLSNGQMKSLFFVKRYLLDKETSITDHIIQIDTFANYMSEQKFIKKAGNKIIILPEGWKRIDELQKNQTDNRQAFIAIAFSENMQKTQEAIEEGIRKAGYTPHVMNKSEHNNQIVPEILYQIKQSKFVVAEFSTNNNGAYYEAGYAAGLGKEVIHICKKDNFGKEGHFDIKQKSTILWETEDEIAELLFKRIEATIGTGK
jgi:nucleoside 2-deoxyribosyltransferase